MRRVAAERTAMTHADARRGPLPPTVTQTPHEKEAPHVSEMLAILVLRYLSGSPAAPRDCLSRQDEYKPLASFVPARLRDNGNPAVHLHLREIVGEYALMSSIDAQAAIGEIGA